MTVSDKPQPTFKKGDRVRLLGDGGGLGTVASWGGMTLRIEMDDNCGDVIVLAYEIEHLTAVERLANLV